MGVPPKHPFIDGIFHYKPSILGYPNFRKPPYCHILLPSSKRLHSYGKSPSLIGKSTINGNVHLLCLFTRGYMIHWRRFGSGRSSGPEPPPEVFFSYHWPSWDRLGPDDVQRHAMVHSLRLFAEKNQVALENVWVWLAP